MEIILEELLVDVIHHWVIVLLIADKAYLIKIWIIKMRKIILTVIPIVDSVTQRRSRIDLVNLLLLSIIIHLLWRGFFVQEAEGENWISDLWYIITLDATEHISVKILLGGTQRVFLILTLIARTGRALKFTESTLEIVFLSRWENITIAVVIHNLLLLFVRQIFGNVWLLRVPYTFSWLVSINRFGIRIFDLSFEIWMVIAIVAIQDIFLQNCLDLLNITLELLSMLNRFDV